MPFESEESDFDGYHKIHKQNSLRVSISNPSNTCEIPLLVQEQNIQEDSSKQATNPLA